MPGPASQLVPPNDADGRPLPARPRHMSFASRWSPPDCHLKKAPVMHEPESARPDRRQFLGLTGFALAAPFVLSSGQGRAQTKALAAAPASGQVPGPGQLKSIAAGVLKVAYVDMGPADGPPVILLHGWPYDIQSFSTCAPMLSAKGYRVIIPYLRGYDPTRFLSADTMRSGQPAALAQDLIDLMDALHIDRAILAGFDWGARTADIVAALWPERTAALVSVSGYLVAGQDAGLAPLPPEAEFQWWYQFYFATERGRAGYTKNRKDFARLIWKLASPSWAFDDATFDRSAAAFDNPDHVDIVVHNYRWRLTLADGDPRYAALDRRIAASPAISVPTITLEGDANGAPHPPPESYAHKFVGRYEHRTITGGIGHNLPQEAPQAFAQAVIDLGSA